MPLIALVPSAIILIALLLAGLLLAFVLLTEGRYFGKGVVRWIYDRFGPAIFGAHSEAGRWRRLAERLDLRGDEVILDVGTAVGDLPLALAHLPDFRGRIVGVDWSPRMMVAAGREARRQGIDGQVQFGVVDVRWALPFAGAAFDLVFCLGLLETLPHPEPVLREFKRVLKPGGRLVLSLYRGWAAWNTALSLEWYAQHLAPLSMCDLEVVPCRSSQDVIIAC